MTTSFQQMELVVQKDGTARFIYSEMLDLTALGQVEIRRASHVEPDDQGRWWADLSPVSGPMLGPFDRRSDALDAEVAWLVQHVIGHCRLVPIDRPSHECPCR
jgi:hypothetical protein